MGSSETPYLSPSGAAKFANCPRSWEYRYLKGLPDPPGEAALIGTFAHRVLESLMGAPRDLRTKSTASYWAAHHWPDMAANPDFEALELDDGGVRKFKWAAWRAVEGLWDLEDPTAIHVDDTETEVRSEVGGVPFLGYVDRIDEGDGDGEIIVDYKSGRLPSGRYLDTPKQQVLLYAAAREHQGHDVAEARLLYLGKATVKVPATAEALQAVSEHFSETWDAIQGTISEGTFLPRPGYLCSHCPYLSSCPEGTAHVGGA